MILASAVLAVVLLGTAVVVPAFAQEPTPKTRDWRGWGCGFGFGRGLCGQAGLEAAAEALGMTADELSTQLWGGRTLADMAEERGADLQVMRDAVEAACEQAIRDAIEQAVEDGRLTREHADRLLEGLDNGYWGPRGFGYGFGFGRGLKRRFGGFFGYARPWMNRQ